ncbi:Tctex1 domain containing-protein 1 [Paragonimus heterotremus]|uniref:Tctex1 domain containing-protein 1 n=1 Tax=Paragonimus heterotremus TaxID=100268 RepID=A0A8J4TQ47_9TREM|nr:Tctex1 domain containing-protein 1 [Paragonimus heterotremus]
MESSTEVDTSVKPRDANQPGSRRPSVALLSRRMSQMSTGGRRSIFGARNSIWSAIRGGGFHKPVKYENTYRTVPKEGELINQQKLSDLVHDTLESTLKSERYDPKRVPTMAMNLANLLRKRVREIITPSRYKIIAQVNIGSCKNATVTLASRAVWDTEDSGDTYAEASYFNSSIYAVALVYCVYFE